MGLGKLLGKVVHGGQDHEQRRPVSKLSDSAFDLDVRLKRGVSIDVSAACSDKPFEPRLVDDPLHEPADEVDPKDVPTPDNWVPRHKALVRLTGRHPLNCEPPLPLLIEKGAVTPVSLHYVRNHGAVPRLSWSHRITIGGAVSNPTSFSVAELMSTFENVTLPITLVCAGNRRKEQNMVRKSKGFNWGPSAIGTSEWTGVRLADVLRYCGINSPKDGGRYVCFSSVKGELPQGKDGSYGTSLFHATAMDPAADVLLAFKQNGRFLAPDHGFPVRMIIPGHIGGRMVKWLSEITVTDRESDNFYHYHDNRVLPPGIDQERAEKAGYWYNPDFVINELNVNSVITSPQHDELVPVNQEGYSIRGYAYSGGGRKVIRCEVSLDGGESWLIARILRHHPPTDAGKHWCWVFWEYEVTTADMVKAQELRCRAVDASNNLQPDRLTWNLMGMMNNPHYRVKAVAQEEGDGSLAVRWEHPVKSGGEEGGWMEREKQAAEAAQGSAIAPAKPAVDVASLAPYTMQQVEAHDSHESAWFVHAGLVYDASRFLAVHPGGAESILIVAGQDATEDFDAIHSKKAKDMMGDYLIGRLADSSASASGQHNDQVEDGLASCDLVALNPKKKIPFTLVEKVALSHNTRLFRFALQSPQHKLGLPIGQHMFFYARDKGELIMRAYTPTSSDANLGYFDLVVKVYFADQHPSFPLGGRMSLYLERMQLGDSIDVKGPLGHFVYLGRGRFRHHGQEGQASQLSMLAGGTGITPMWQIVQAVLADPEDATRIKLVFANQTQDDILLQAELDELVAAHPARFQVVYILSRAQGSWAGHKGRVCEAFIKEHCYAASANTLALLCGPQGMIDQACIPNLKKLGYDDDHIVVF
ncbi:hypothetical protein WJX72_000662 [[Myrmecia] bisecta]|uniref:Nitrate reductase n=1 Tax=[Myrmecia] bisecta TaxID=41462 RepID=A0AAW1QPJ1_9CHLO